MPGVRIFPFKEVESGSQVYENLIFEARSTPQLFGQGAVSGLVNVDLTPDTALKVAAALGTALKRDARVVAGRESAPACRMIKRAMISGVNSTGVNVADLRVLPASVARHLLKSRVRRRFPRGSQQQRSGGRENPVLRASRHRGVGRVPEGDRETLQPARAPPGGGGTSVRSATRPAHARLCRRPARQPGSRGDPTA